MSTDEQTRTLGIQALETQAIWTKTT